MSRDEQTIHYGCLNGGVYKQFILGQCANCKFDPELANFVGRSVFGKQAVSESQLLGLRMCRMCGGEG